MPCTLVINRFVVPFEGTESKNDIKFLLRTFFGQKNLGFLGVGPPKSDGKLKLSDFDENGYPGVFDVADFKNRIHFYVEPLSGGL